MCCNTLTLLCVAPENVSHNDWSTAGRDFPAISDTFSTRLTASPEMPEADRQPESVGSPSFPEDSTCPVPSPSSRGQPQHICAWFRYSRDQARARSPQYLRRIVTTPSQFRDGSCAVRPSCQPG